VELVPKSEEDAEETRADDGEVEQVGPGEGRHHQRLQALLFFVPITLIFHLIGS
jgi:hypothetical protein